MSTVCVTLRGRQAKALKLVSDFGTIENMPPEVRDPLGSEISAVREIFLRPGVTDNYEIQFTRPDPDGIVRFFMR